jgi:hypothetical protein
VVTESYESHKLRRSAPRLMEITARSLKLAAIITAALINGDASANAQIPAPDPTHYENIDYQFSLDLPRGLPACVSEHTNHGVSILFDPTITCKEYDGKGRHISVFAEYNVPYEARTATQLARRDCSNPGFPRRDPSFQHVEWFRGVTLSARRAAGCRQYFSDGRIAEWIVTLRKTDDHVWGWVEVAAYLETTVQHYKDDMRIFRKVLNGIWIHPDGPLE